jgi:hypothetical protein
VGSSLVSSFSNFHGRAIMEPSFCFSSFCRTRKSTTEWRSNPFFSFKSCLLRLHWYTPSTKTYIEMPGAINRSEVRWTEKDCGLLGTGTKVSTDPSPYVVPNSCNLRWLSESSIAQVRSLSVGILGRRAVPGGFFKCVGVSMCRKSLRLT